MEKKVSVSDLVEEFFPKKKDKPEVRHMVQYKKEMVAVQRLRKRVSGVFETDDAGNKTRKTVWGYERVGGLTGIVSYDGRDKFRQKILRPQLVDCSHGPGDIIIGHYGQKYEMQDDGSLRRVRG